MPEAYQQFMEITSTLERHYKEMQDVEFTIERGKLWMLQTRNGKRTAKAAVKNCSRYGNEGLISKEDAVQRVYNGKRRYAAPSTVRRKSQERSREDRKIPRQRCECFTRRRRRTGLFRCGYCRENGQRRETEHYHGAPVHEARRCSRHDCFKGCFDQ